MSEVSCIDYCEYLTILARATQNLQKLIEFKASQIEILYGDESETRFFVQFSVPESEKLVDYLNIAEDLSTFYESQFLAEQLSQVFGLNRVRFGF